MHQRLEKVVVTGGAGFVGSHLVDRLLADTRAQVVVVDNLSRGRLTNLARHQADPRLHVVEGDVRDAALVSQTVRGADLVFHLAAQATVMGAVEDLDYSFSTNVVGTFNVLRESAAGGVGRVVFSSSREVYGEPIELPVDEGQPLLAINFYGASKVVGEAYCRAFRRASGLDTVILRLANAYGPRDYGRVIPLWIDQAGQGQDLHVYGGKQVLDFVWVDQVVDALLAAGTADVALPPINVGSGTGTKLMDLARRIRLLSGGRGQIQIVPARPMEVVQYVARIDRMRQLLGIEPPADPLLHLDKLVQSPVALAMR
ncbi:MAG TPA: NAD-dependent epimerase/dehydratase family protein [Chloroflexota bacterium]|jgi:UDP-glucose 4-epimerase